MTEQWRVVHGYNGWYDYQREFWAQVAIAALLEWGHYMDLGPYGRAQCNTWLMQQALPL